MYIVNKAEDTASFSAVSGSRSVSPDAADFCQRGVQQYKNALLLLICLLQFFCYIVRKHK